MSIKIKILGLLIFILYFQLFGCNNNPLSFSYVSQKDSKLKSLTNAEECLKQSITNTMETIKVIINKSLESNTNNAALHLLQRHLFEKKFNATNIFVCIYPNTVKGVVVINPHRTYKNTPFKYYSYVIQITTNETNTIFLHDYKGYYRSSSSCDINRDIDYFLADTNLPYKIGIDANYYSKDGSTHVFCFFTIDKRKPVIKRTMVINNLSGIFIRKKLGKILNFKFKGIFKNEEDYYQFKEKGLVYSNMITQYPDILNHIYNLYYVILDGDEILSRSRKRL